MAEINLSPTLNVTPDLAAARVTPVVSTPPMFSQPNPTGAEVVQEGLQNYGAVSEANVRKIENEQKARKLKADAAFNTMPIEDQTAVLSYHKDYGAIPRNPMGGIDVEKIRADREEDARLRRANFIMASSMAGMKENTVVKVNPKTGMQEEVWQMIDPSTGDIVSETWTGGLPSTATGAGTKGGFTALQAAEEAQAIAASEEVHKDVARAKEILTRVNSVGPLVGSAVGGFLGRVKAALGSEQQYNAQRTLTRLISGQTMENANKLKGPLTEKELGFLRNSIPGLHDTEATWGLWLDDLDKFYKRSLAERKAALEGRPMTAEQLSAISPPGRGGVSEVPAPSPAGTPASTPAPAFPAIPSMDGTMSFTGRNVVPTSSPRRTSL